MILKEQIPQECTLRTYNAILNFEMSAEKEDVMEWMHLEPSIHQNVKCKDDSTQRNVKCKDDSTQKNNNEKNNPKTIIKALRIENLNLRQKIRRLKYRLQCMAQTCKESNQKAEERNAKEFNK